MFGRHYVFRNYMKYIFRNENDVFNGNYPWLNGLSDLHATNVNKTWKFNTSYTCCGLSEIGNIQHKCNDPNFEFLTQVHWFLHFLTQVRVTSSCQKGYTIVYTTRLGLCHYTQLISSPDSMTD